MSKMSTELRRHALNGPTMGTRWSALFFAEATLDLAPILDALQIAAEEVDAQMSTWNPRSDLMRLNAAPVGEWIEIPARLRDVLRLGLAIGRQTGGAFDIAMGDAVTAWGFGPDSASSEAIRAAMTAPRRPAHEGLEIEARRARKTAPLALDLNGIAKGYGTDRLAEVLRTHGITQALVGIDGEMRALGLRPDGQPWAVAVEAPDSTQRRPHSVLALEEAAVATSGDYRHWVDVQGRRLSHTMDPSRRAPLADSPASVTVIAESCAEADAWATALMVLGVEAGRALAQAHRLNALFLRRRRDGAVEPIATGALFAEPARCGNRGGGEPA